MEKLIGNARPIETRRVGTRTVNRISSGFVSESAVPDVDIEEES